MSGGGEFVALQVSSKQLNSKGKLEEDATQPEVSGLKLSPSCCNADACASQQHNWGKPISANAIKLNNFALWSSAGCVMPYLSVYFLHYTQASSEDVGIFMLISSFLGIFTSVLFSSLADRYQAYRFVYLSSLLLSYTSYLILAVPILISISDATGQANSNQDPSLSVSVETTISDNEAAANTTGGLLVPLASAFSGDNNAVQVDEYDQQQQQQQTTTRTTIDQLSPVWFYIIGICVAIGNMSSTVNMSFSDSFSTNTARLQQQANLQTDSGSSSNSNNSAPSFGSLRFFGSIGWLVASFALSLIGEFTPNLPYLLASWSLFALLATLNILLVLFWPDKRPFDLADRGQARQLSDITTANGDCGDHNQHQQHQQRRRHDKSSIPWRTISHTMRSLQFTRRKRARKLQIGSGHHFFNEVAIAPVSKLVNSRDRDVSSTLGQVHLIDLKSYAFDEQNYADEIAIAHLGRHNVRRCSIATLGNSYICEQFVIQTSNSNSNSNNHNNHNNQNALEHFKCIVKIVPIKHATDSKSAKSLESAANDRVHHHGQLQQEVEEGATDQQTTAPAPAAQLEPINLRLYLKIIELIARRNKNMLRFMWLYTMIGFIMSMNLIYLFPYLESLNETKFKTLAAHVMISSYLSETLFYYLSSKITNKLSASNGLSFVLLIFAIRYSLYLTFATWPNYDYWPLEMIVLIESMQSICQGWFECIFNESALEFALEAEQCVPQLIELNLIANTSESIEQVKNSVKLALVSLSACCLEGIGVGFGSFVGGWLIYNYNYFTLWALCAGFALTICMANIMIELLWFKKPMQQEQQKQFRIEQQQV